MYEELQFCKQRTVILLNLAVANANGITYLLLTLVYPDAHRDTKPNNVNELLLSDMIMSSCK